jgi:hypothetical protein
MTNSRFEVSYYEGEFNERAPGWSVIEWTGVSPHTGVMSGRTVELFEDSPYGERQARELAGILQEAYNIDFHANFG